jgi:hypothetical protein
VPAPGAPPTAGPGLSLGPRLKPALGAVRLSGLVHSVFPHRGEPLAKLDPGLARDVLAAYGREDEFESFLQRTGNGFIAMSEELLGRLPGPLPETDAVLLAYHTPDLHHPDVAGCYLAQRLPGTPTPCSVAEQGPAAAFTALRIADGMCRLGDLGHGTLFVFDQFAAVWEADEAVQGRPDAAVLLLLGATGEVVVSDLGEVAVGGLNGPGPAQALDEVAGRHPGVRVLVGTALAAQLAGALRGYPVETAAPESWGTGVWAALAQAWPIREPVLVAEYQEVGGRLHSCLLTPEAGP